MNPSLLDMKEKTTADMAERRGFGALVPGLASFDALPLIPAEEFPDLGLPGKPFAIRRRGEAAERRYFVQAGWIEHLQVVGTGEEITLPAGSGSVRVAVDIDRESTSQPGANGSTVTFQNGNYVLTNARLLVLPTGTAAPSGTGVLVATLFSFTNGETASYAGRANYRVHPRLESLASF